MVKCSVCQIVAFSEKAHMRARHSFKKHEFDKYQNIIPICPVCHYFFDKKAFTLHHKWKCWIFSDCPTFSSGVGEIENPYFKVQYVFPAEEHQLLINQLSEENIISNQENEFMNKSQLPPDFYFKNLKRLLKMQGLWNSMKSRPKLRYLNTNIEIIQIEE